MDNRKFIQLVKSHPHIWSTKLSFAIDRVIRQKEWSEIAREMISNFSDLSPHNQNLEIHNLMTKWKYIREKYRKNKRLGKTYSLSNHLKFLDDVLAVKPRKVVVQSESDFTIKDDETPIQFFDSKSYDDNFWCPEMNAIDSEKIIELVESNPALWDYNNAQFYNASFKSNLWKDICQSIKPGLRLEQEENNFRNAVIKRWNTIHHSYKVNNVKCEYFDKLKFLQDNQLNSRDNDNIGDSTCSSLNKPVFDKLTFINLIKEYPQIWDNSTNFDNESLNQHEWTKVFLRFYPDWNSYTLDQKEELAQMCIRKWNCLTKNYNNDIKSPQELTTYKYSKVLSFLNQNSEERLKTAIIHNTVKNDLIIDKPQLIICVKKKPTIWNKTDDNYYNLPVRDSLWLKISHDMDLCNTEHDETYIRDELLLKWSGIYDSYKEFLMGRNNEFKYSEELTFIKEEVQHLIRREKDNEECENTNNSSTSYDTTRLIDVIKEYPCIWYRKQPEPDQHYLKKCWNGVCARLYPDWHIFTVNQREKEIKSCKVKWKNVYERFVRLLKYRQRYNRNSNIYSGLLEFLKVNFDDSTPHSELYDDYSLNDNIDTKIDTKQLIIVVKNNPLLWSKQHAQYSDLYLRDNAWMDCCLALDSNFVTKPEKEKHRIRDKVIDQWITIYDLFKKSQEDNSASEYDQLMTFIDYQFSSNKTITEDQPNCSNYKVGKNSKTKNVKENIDMFKLIELVKSHPDLWDNPNPVKPNLRMQAQLKQHNWEDIANVLIPGWGTLLNKDKTKAVNVIKNKWKGVHDQYKRKCKTQSTTSFKYSEALSFLRENFENDTANISRQKTHTSNSDDSEDNGNSNVSWTSGNYNLELCKSDIHDPNDDEYISEENVSSMEVQITENGLINSHEIALPVVGSSDGEFIPETNAQKSNRSIHPDLAYLLSLKPQYKALSHEQKLDFRIYALQFFKYEYQQSSLSE